MLVTLATKSPAGHEPSTGRAALQQRAEELIAQRRSGATAMLEALRRARTRSEPDNKAGTGRARTLWRQLRARSQPPRMPIVALTVALEAMREPRAMRPLARLLLDPTVAPAHAERIGAAIRALVSARPPENDAEPLRRILASYLTREGCNPADPRTAEALLSVAHAVVALGGRDLVARMATDSCDEGPMRTSLQAAAAATAP